MLASAEATNKRFGVTAHSTLLLPLSPDYIAGKMQIIRAIASQCRLVAEKPSSRPFTDLDLPECTLASIVPSQIAGLLQSPISRRITNVIIGGAPITPGQEKSVVEAGLNAYATYGMTETCSHVALRKLGEPYYTGLPGFTFSTDHRDCLVIKTTTLSFGELTTNDMVELKSDNAFIWLGRYDNVINSGGIKIHPEELERAISPLLPPDATAYVTSRKSEQWGEEVIIVTNSHNVSYDILNELKDILPRYQHPHGIIYVNEIPRTSSGKIIRTRF